MWSTTLIPPTALTTVTNAAPLDLANPLEVAGVGVLGGTVLRTHIRVSAVCSNTDANPALMWGIVVFDQASAAVGRPDPAIEFNLDWMINVRTDPENTPNSVAFASSLGYGEEIDLRARRRLREVNDRPLFCIKNMGSTTVSYAAFIKMLIALP
jgi:hypothetical protein